MTAINVQISSRPTGRGYISPDDLVSRLSRPSEIRNPGAILAFAQAVLTFGMLPLLLWPARWGSLVEAERRDLLDLLARWRSRVAPTDARPLDQLAYRLRSRPMLMVLPWLAVAFNGIMIFALLSQGDSLSRVWDLTYHHVLKTPPQSVAVDDRATSEDFDINVNSVHAAAKGAIEELDHASNDPQKQLELHLFQVWIWGLTLAYACHYYAVRSYTGTVDAVAQWTNRLAESHGLPTVNGNPLASGLGPIWIVTAIVLCGMNAWWGIPLVLGGAMQRQYTRVGSQRIRSALAWQLRDGFAMTAPYSSANTAAFRLCSSSHCGARLPAAANFCPRCGAAAMEEINAER